MGSQWFPFVLVNCSSHEVSWFQLYKTYTLCANSVKYVVEMWMFFLLDLIFNLIKSGCLTLFSLCFFWILFIYYLFSFKGKYWHTHPISSPAALQPGRCLTNWAIGGFLVVYVKGRCLTNWAIGGLPCLDIWFEYCVEQVCMNGMRTAEYKMKSWTSLVTSILLNIWTPGHWMPL